MTEPTRGPMLVASGVAIVGGITAYLFARSAWWETACPGRRFPTPSGGSAFVHCDVRLLSHPEGAVFFAAVAVTLLAIIAPLVRGPVRTVMLVLAILAAVDVVIGSLTALSNHRDLVALGAEPAVTTTSAPWIVVGGGVLSLGAGLFMLLRLRSAPSLRMPEGPPSDRDTREGADQGVWE